MVFQKKSQDDNNGGFSVLSLYPTSGYYCFIVISFTSIACIVINVLNYLSCFFK